MASVVESDGPPRRRSRLLWWMLALFALDALLVAGGIAAGIWRGVGLFAEQAQVALQRHPAISEHLGRLETVEFNFMATGEASGSDEFVFDVVGEHGRARVLAQMATVDADNEVVAGGVMTLDDGSEIRLASLQDIKPLGL